MSDLLAQVLEAHGGLANWNHVTRLEVHGSLGGPFWASKGWPGVYDDITVTLDPRHVDIAFRPYPVAGHTSRFVAGPERLELRDEDGALVEGRDRPRETFPSTDGPNSWDAIQTSYFTSCACWNYFTAPFLFTYPGVFTRELTAWNEEGETWRRLAVTFPRDLPNHNLHQIFYYGEDYLLRRMDYHPDVTDSPIAHYTYDHKTFDGFVFPTRRRVYVHDSEGQADKEFVPITLDIESVRVTND